MPNWRFWLSREEQELVRLRWKVAELQGRLEKQNQFIEGLAQKFPQVREEYDRMRRGYTSKPERPAESLAPI